MPPQATAATPSPYMTKRKVAEYLRRSERSIDRLKLKRIKAGNRVLYHRETIDAAMKAIEG